MLSVEENKVLTQTGAGTPMGELFRRFWLPALIPNELSSDGVPVRLRIMSEDLVAFRDTNGKVGIIDAYCPHKRAPLFFGRNEECGLRCVYHGWKFDVDGNCVEMANEPPEHRFEDKVKTKAYPTQEWGGLIWVYMGPAHLEPELPQFEWGRVPESHRHLARWLQLDGIEPQLSSRTLARNRRKGVTLQLSSGQRCRRCPSRRSALRVAGPLHAPNRVPPAFCWRRPALLPGPRRPMPADAAPVHPIWRVEIRPRQPRSTPWHVLLALLAIQLVQMIVCKIVQEPGVEI